MIKCIFSVTLLKGAALLHGKTDHQPHGVGAEDGGLLFRLGPNAIFMIAKDRNARFGAERVEHLVFLDQEHAHSGDGPWSPLCPKGLIVGKTDLSVSVLRFDARLFFPKAGQPRVAIGMGVVKGCE